MDLKLDYIALIIFSCFLGSCTREMHDEETNLSETLGELVLRKSDYGKGEILFKQPTVKSVDNVVVLNGFLEVPPESKSIVSAYFPGYLKGFRLLEGQKVKKGQVLAYIQNPDFIQIQQDYLVAKEKLNYLQEEYERKKTLNDENITSKRDFLKAESDYNVTLAEYMALKEKLRLLRVNTGNLEKGNITSIISVISPMDGNVSTIHAANGAFLSPSDEILEIVSTEHLHLELQVFEADLRYIKEGQKVEFRLSQWGETWYKAEIHLVGKEIHEEKRTVRIHCHIEEPEGVQFIPGLYAEARVVTDQKEIISLPENALYKANDAGYVWQKKSESDTAFILEKHWIRPGIITEGLVEVKGEDIGESAQVLVAPTLE